MVISVDDIFNRVASFANSKTDVAIAKLLGMSRQAIANARKRETVPFEKICTFAIKNDVSLDYLFLGIGTEFGYGGSVDAVLLEAIEMEFLECSRKHQLQVGNSYSHDLALIYNRVVKKIRPGEWSPAIKEEVRYLVEIRRSDSIRSNKLTREPLIVHEEEQKLLKRAGETIKNVFGEDCVNPIESDLK